MFIPLIMFLLGAGSAYWGLHQLCNYIKAKAFKQNVYMIMASLFVVLIAVIMMEDAIKQVINLIE
jgi:hypothetical protein